MKLIKTYEGFLDIFKKKSEEPKDNIINKFTTEQMKDICAELSDDFDIDVYQKIKPAVFGKRETVEKSLVGYTKDSDKLYLKVTDIPKNVANCYILSARVITENNVTDGSLIEDSKLYDELDRFFKIKSELYEFKFIILKDIRLTSKTKIVKNIYTVIIHL